MLKLDRIINISLLYSVASIFIGPGLVFISSRHPSGWDCSDSAWGLETLAEREAIYDHNARFMAPVAILMAVLGVIIIGYLLYFGVKEKKIKRIIAPILLILFMLGGYSLLITVATSGWC